MTNYSEIGLNSFIGQKEIVQNLRELIEVCTENNTILPSMIIKAPEGMGKVTLARKISESTGNPIQLFKGQAISKERELGVILAHMNFGDYLVIEEIQRVGAICIEGLLLAAEQHVLAFILGKGNKARSINIKLPGFTLIGTSSEPWKISSEIRKSSLLMYDFSYYTEDDVQQAIICEANKLAVNIDTDAIIYITNLADFIPGQAITILRKIISYSPAKCNIKLTLSIAQKAGKYLGIDKEYNGNFVTSEKICSMDGIEFEHFVASMFKRKGYSVTETATTGDHGVDLFLQKDGELDIVQCKVRTSSLVGEPTIRDFLGAIVSSKAERGYFVTTSKFTNQAIAFSQGKPIILIDINMLVKISNS